MSSYNTSKEKKHLQSFLWTLWPHFRLLLWLKLELILWHISQMPPLVLKPQVEWIFPFLSYGICRMKRRRIKGLKTPEQTCLALISLLSGTERQKECSKPELLLALMRHKSAFCGMWYVQYGKTQLLSLTLIWFPALLLPAGTPGVGGQWEQAVVFIPVKSFPSPEFPGALSMQSPAEHSHEGPVQHCSPSCQPNIPSIFWIWSEAHKKLSIFWTLTPPRPRIHLRCLVWQTSRNEAIEKDSSVRGSSSWEALF